MCKTVRYLQLFPWFRTPKRPKKKLKNIVVTADLASNEGFVVVKSWCQCVTGNILEAVTFHKLSFWNVWLVTVLLLMTLHIIWSLYGSNYYYIGLRYKVMSKYWDRLIYGTQFPFSTFLKIFKLFIFFTLCVFLEQKVIVFFYCKLLQQF